jgi:hypothetical protein
VFENRVLRRIYVPRREEVAGGWRRLHNEQLHKLCASLNIIRVKKSRRMRGTELNHAWGRREMRTRLWFEKLTGRDHSQDQGIDERIILEWILGK